MSVTAEVVVYIILIWDQTVTADDMRMRERYNPSDMREETLKQGLTSKQYASYPT